LESPYIAGEATSLLSACCGQVTHYLDPGPVGVSPYRTASHGGRSYKGSPFSALSRLWWRADGRSESVGDAGGNEGRNATRRNSSGRGVCGCVAGRIHAMAIFL